MSGSHKQVNAQLMLLSLLNWCDQETVLGRELGGIAYLFHGFLLTVIENYEAPLKFWGYEVCPSYYQSQ